jgi:hypothetical protein
VIVLNVGGGAGRELPPIYKGWEQDLLDIDPEVKPDVCCDAKEMRKLKSAKYDAVYCSHNLEHFYRHDVPVVLGGMHHVLKDTGFAHISVPDVIALMEAVVKGNRDIEDTWYPIPGSAISFHDVLYGWNKVMAQGNLYYAHKCGFSEKSLGKALRAAQFRSVHVARDGMNLHAFAFKTKPTEAKLRSLGI